jgi:hypothetical protein
MLKRNIAAAALLALPLSLQADTPDIEPGLWEYTTTTTIEGSPIPIPPQEETSTECLTEADMEDPMVLLGEMDAMEECSISDLNQDSRTMQFTMTCLEPQMGMTLEMVVDMNFSGNSMNGTMTGSMMSPMGEFTMRITHAGSRIGSCS